MEIAIVSDTSCDLPGSLISELGIRTVPLMFRFGLEEFADKSMPMRDFFERVEKIWPTTSAPAPGDYLKVFRECLEQKSKVLCFTVSGKHSASYSSAVLASQYFKPGQVKVIDSASVSIGQGLQVMAASLAARSKEGLDAILRKVKEVQSRSHLFIALDTVRYLVKGGRASQLTGFLAGILQIRPILTMREGQLSVVDRPRPSAFKKRLIEQAKAFFPAKFVAVGHVSCEDEARELAAEISRETGFPETEIPIIETGMAIATHGGPGTIGIMVVSADPA